MMQMYFARLRPTFGATVSSNLFKLLDKCDVSTVELLLVARLGLEGVDCLRHAIHTVPEGFLTTREKFISDMVNKISTVPLSQEECRCPRDMGPP